MIENILFGKAALPGELVRLVVAFLGTLGATYYDVYNKRNVPDKYLYGFLAVAFLVDLGTALMVSTQAAMDVFLFSLGIAVFFSAIFYVFYRMGQLGGADVIVMASVMLLLPLHPSVTDISFNFPFLFSTMVFAGTAFALYVVLYYGAKMITEGASPKWSYALMLIPYLLFVYVFLNSPLLFSPVYLVLISVLFIATTFFLMFKEDLNLMLSERMALSQAEPEDVLALEVMDPAIVKKYGMKRLLTKGELERLAERGVKEVTVYSKLPPFLPFFLLGMLLAAFFAGSLLLM